MTRCCLCRRDDCEQEATTLPGTGWRCVDRDACHSRRREIIDAHLGLAAAFDGNWRQRAIEGAYAYTRERWAEVLTDLETR